jgi:L-lactate dehydrogenase complex protein LldF
MASTTENRHPHSPSFEELYEQALADSQLSRNLTRFQQSWRETRDAQVADVDFPALRGRMKAAKTEAIDNLDHYLDQFIAAARAAGSTVHLAADADDANRIIRDIALQNGVQVVAKSKSMVSEETELNQALAEDGIEAVETDLGEWIVQIRNERPSHMVMPAIHLSRQQVGDVFTTHLGKPVSRDDVGEQVRVAKDAIRDVFFRAGMGITGANALIAESGTVMMCTNEGNGRLTSSIPPVHVVLAGIEKLVPTYDDAMTQLRLLARNATAQRITVYTTFIQGPTPGHQQHIVLLDNGRRRMREMPEFREALHCIRCAACANVCPPYREVGGHVFGHIYSGAIGLVVTPFFHGIDAVAGPQSLCLSCNACETVCPVGIPLPRQILDVRKMVVAHKGMKQPKAVILKAWSNPSAANLLLKIGARAQKPLTRGGRFLRARRLPVLNRQTKWRSLPSLADRPLHDRGDLPSTSFRGGVRPPASNRRGQSGVAAPLIPNDAAGMRVALFPGCMTDRLYPEQGEAVVSILNALGATTVHPPSLHCCGLIPNNSGDGVSAGALALRTMESLEAIEADVIVSPSASCVAMMVDDYQHLFRDDSPNLARAKALSAKIMDLTSFLVHVAKLQPGALSSPDGTQRKVTYHDSCQGLNALGLRDEPRYLIETVMDDTLLEMAENRVCCGFGGSFSLEQPELSRRLMTRKLENAQAAGATTVVTDNQGCIMHLRGGVDAQGRPMRIRHLAEVIAERINARETQPR